MASDNMYQFVYKVEGREIIYKLIILPLAQMIFAGELNPVTATRDEFYNALQDLGMNHENAVEAYLTHLPEEMALVHHCVEQSQPRAAIVLLFTLLESELNTLVRVHLRTEVLRPL